MIADSLAPPTFFSVIVLGSSDYPCFPHLFLHYTLLVPPSIVTSIASHSPLSL